MATNSQKYKIEDTTTAGGFSPLSGAPQTYNLQTPYSQGQAANVYGGSAPQGAPQASGQSSAPQFTKQANSPHVYNSQGVPVSYEQYIAQGGKPDFSNVRTVGGSGSGGPTPQIGPLSQGTSPASGGGSLPNAPYQAMALAYFETGDNSLLDSHAAVRNQQVAAQQIAQSLGIQNWNRLSFKLSMPVIKPL